MRRMTTRTWLGVMVLVASVALGIGAHGMYQSGLPGSPKLEQGFRIAVGPEVPQDTARVRVLSPADVTTSTDARFILRGRATSAGELELRLRVVSAHPTTYLVLQLGGGAVSTDLQVVDDLATRETSALVLRVVEVPSTLAIPEYRKFYDLQLVVVRINPEAASQRSDGRYVGRATFRIQMRDPAIARENARYVVATPTVMRPRLCQQLDVIERDEDTAAIAGDFLERGGCVDPPAGAPAQQTVSLVIPPVYFRADYTLPQVEEPGLLSWTGREDLGVRASLVSIDDEAAGQRLLFFSGIAAGLASGFMPLAVELLASGRRVPPRQGHVPTDVSAA